MNDRGITLSDVRLWGGRFCRVRVKTEGNRFKWLRGPIRYCEDGLYMYGDKINYSKIKGFSR